MKRLSSIVTKSDFQEHLGDVEMANSIIHSYAIDLHDDISIILNKAGQNVAASWGLNPDPDKRSINLPQVNFHRIHVKPTFRMAFRKQRAVATLDSYYCWHKDQRIPYRIRKVNSTPMFVPCVYFPIEEDKYVCTLITRPARQNLSRLAEVEPLIFDKEETKTWLSHLNAKEAIKLLEANPSVALDKQKAPAKTMIKGFKDRMLHNEAIEELTLFK
ncbi:MAG: hypothetical protein HKN87_14390 [Saprospiraceae bacterium]|nr:hypothetical protein [Saprospiraceae bacterium]